MSACRPHRLRTVFLSAELLNGSSQIRAIAAVDHAMWCAASAEKYVCLNDEGIRSGLGLQAPINERRAVDLVGRDRADGGAAETQHRHQNR